MAITEPVQTMNHSEAKPPLISVALCTYNGARFISQQLQSILDQTYSHLEIVIVDDNSTDDTPGILEHYASADPRIKLYRNLQNIGFVRNFEKALQACSGELIALSDQDDIWFPEKLETLYRDIGTDRLIYSAVDLIDENDKPLPGTFPRVKRIEGECPLSLILGNCVIGHTCLMRKELIETATPIPPRLFSHDQWLAIVAAASGQLKACDTVLSYYRRHGDNTIFNGKRKRPVSKAENALRKTDRLTYLSDKVIDSNFLGKDDKAKLIEYRRLLQKNRTCFYNFELASFLKTNHSEFLRLFKNPKKTIKKQCRGYWYYKIFPFL